MKAREAELLPVDYFHVVFTLPSPLGPIALQNQREVYGLLFRAVAETLWQIAADPKHLRAEIEFLAILHTWGQNLQHRKRKNELEILRVMLHRRCQRLDIVILQRFAMTQQLNIPAEPPLPRAAASTQSP